MLDPLLSLAFSVQSNKGVYALLLGSGASRSAGIPTGWEILLDLVRKLAHIRRENCEPDPAAWFTTVFGKPPDYAELLETLSKSPAERSQLLRAYFEPSDEERQQGQKVPSSAHHGIARLVARGYFRVIITTNFDRLIEKALEAGGIVPTLISTPDSSEGALPLIHSSCTVIKVHGDYLDTRIKNSPAELLHYDERINRLLDRVFEEFGVIVCGWSGDWDPAMRAALERCSSRRFTQFWAFRGEISDTASRLVKFRNAESVSIKDADTFFSELEERINALEEFSRPHPLSAAVAETSIKQLLPDKTNRIRLHDSVLKETEKLYENLSESHFPALNIPPTKDEFLKRVKHYESLTEVLSAMICAGCYWGESHHEEVWTKSMSRIADLGIRNGMIVWLDLKKYPALILFYVAGMASLAGKRHSNLAAILTRTRIREGDKEKAFALGLNTWGVIDKNVAQLLPNMERRYAPLSDHLCITLRERLRRYIPQQADYERCFDRFECLLALVYLDLSEKQKGLSTGWAPAGSFAWKYRLDADMSIMNEIDREATLSAENWPLIQAGLFDHSLARFRAARDVLSTFVSGLHWY